MDNWHTAECKKPDITVFPGLGLPSCMNCGGICPSHKVDTKCNDELKIPQAGKRSAMQLEWPPSISYQDYAYQNDPDGSMHKALISELDKGWYDEGADQRMLPSSITNSSQPQSSQGSKTSYEALDGTKIRILRLSKGCFGDCLHGNFETVSLESENTEHEETQVVLSNEKKRHISYEAVSYTWAKGNGRREKDHVIFIGPRWDTLPITQNCFDALQNCRLEGKDRCLWVDAICINQSNISERTHQVSMMREIYSAASQVLIYLDIDDTESGSNITHDPQILSQNPYFSRIWVVQEIASAKQAVVLYVRQVMGWSFFHHNLQWLPGKKWMRHFGSPRQIDDANGFLTLLEDTRDCNASDPRDKIFALLGLWKGDMDPDYTLSPQAVYTGLAASLVTDRDKEVAGRLLDMASHDRSMPGLPSWVPDWSQKSRQIYQKRWKIFSRPGMLSESKDGKFKVHRQTGSLCALAAEMDVLASYFSCGFLPTINGMLTATSGYTQISLPREILYKCEPNDRIFILADYDFGLIVRKKACPDIYNLVGLCEYSDLNNGPTKELDAIRYFQDWAWLLSVHGKQPWSEIGNWGKLHNCWRALRQQRKAERRSFFQRLIRKSHLLKQVQDLIQDARYALSNYRSNKRPKQAFFAQTWTSVRRDDPRMCTFFEHRWERIYNKWKQADKLMAFPQEERRSLIRALLPGYRSLAPLEDNPAQPALEQSMWLPVSPQWFEVHPRRDRDEFYAHYPLLAACASRNIPLPPLHLIDDFKRHIVLSLGLELESGLRQLQRVEREQLPHVLPSDETPMTSYSLESFIVFDFYTEEWKTFLYWLSKPTSPSYDRLKEGARENLELIWEPRYISQGLLNKAHSWLDTNFDHYMTALSGASGSEPSLSRFFSLVYREQLDLLWQFVFYEKSPYKHFRRMIRSATSAELAHAFFWRFDRSIDKACQLIGIAPLTRGQTEEQWTKFLEWLAQRSFEEQVSEMPSEELYKPRPRADYPENYNHNAGFLEDIKCVEPLHPKRLAPNGEARLSELIQSEIQRRRLAERTFDFLYKDTQAAQKAVINDFDHLFDLIANDQLHNCSEPFAKKWRQDNASWKAVEEYILESERHMNSLKFKLLWGDKPILRDEDVYKEIVII